jgi:hypothetical protein
MSKTFATSTETSATIFVTARDAGRRAGAPDSAPPPTGSIPRLANCSAIRIGCMFLRAMNADAAQGVQQSSNIHQNVAFIPP